MLSTTANVVAAAPQPIASVATATTVIAGRCDSERNAERASHSTVLLTFLRYADRDDNLLCVAAVLLEDALVVKTAMHRFQLS
jgi:hypothetical protein